MKGTKVQEEEKEVEEEESVREIIGVGCMGEVLGGCVGEMKVVDE